MNENKLEVLKIICSIVPKIILKYRLYDEWPVQHLIIVGIITKYQDQAALQAGIILPIIPGKKACNYRLVTGLNRFSCGIPYFVCDRL